MSVKIKISGYISRDFDLIEWDGIQEFAFLTPYPSTDDSVKPCTRDAGITE